MPDEYVNRQVPDTKKCPSLALDAGVTAAQIGNALGQWIGSLSVLHGQVVKGGINELSNRQGFPEFLQGASDMLVQIYRCSLDIKVQLGRHSRSIGLEIPDRKQSRDALRIVTESLISSLEALRAMHLDLKDKTPKSKHNQDALDQLSLYVREMQLLSTQLRAMEKRRKTDAMTESKDPVDRTFATILAICGRMKRSFGDVINGRK